MLWQTGGLIVETKKEGEISPLLHTRQDSWGYSISFGLASLYRTYLLGNKMREEAKKALFLAETMSHSVMEKGG